MRIVQSSQVGQELEVVYYVGNRLLRQPVKLAGRNGGSSPGNELPSPELLPEPRAVPAETPLSDSSRPLLNRLGDVLDEVLDEVVDPASGSVPLPERVFPETVPAEPPAAQEIRASKSRSEFGPGSERRKRGHVEGQAVPGNGSVQHRALEFQRSCGQDRDNKEVQAFRDWVLQKFVDE